MGLHPNNIPFIILGPNLFDAIGCVSCRMICHFNDFRNPNPHVKSLGPNFKFLTNRIGLLVYSLFKLDLGPRVKRALGFECGNGACPERPWLLQLVREEACGNKVGESGRKCAACIFKQECSPWRSPFPQMVFLCAPTTYAHFPFSHLRFYLHPCL